MTQDTYRGEQADPMTWHLHAYCANNPINYTDPSGHAAVKNGVKTLSKYAAYYPFVLIGALFTWKNATVSYTYTGSGSKKKLKKIKSIKSFLTGVAVIVSWKQTGSASNIAKKKKSASITCKGKWILGVAIGGYDVGFSGKDTWKFTLKPQM